MGRYKGKRLKQNAFLAWFLTPRAAGPRQTEGPEAAGTAAVAPVRAGSAVSRTGKSKWFLIGLAIYGGLLLAVSAFLQIRLWVYLGDSQAEMDRQAAEKAAQQAYETALRQAPQLAFEDWRSGLTADYWTDLWYAKAACGLDARESVRAFMAERFASGAAQAYKATGFTSEAPVYVLKNGEDSLARITMTGSGLNWSVSDVELLIEGTRSVSFAAADSCQVYCNGRQLGEEYAEPAESRFHYALLENRLEGAVKWVSYHVEGLLLEPELTVEPPEGYSVIRTEDGDYLLGLERDTDAYTNLSVRFVQYYLYYYMRGETNPSTNMYNVLSFLTPGTKAYQDIQDTYIGVYYAATYSDVDTSKTYVENVIFWADNCFSIDVTYDADCTWKGQHVDYADATMRIYYLRSGNRYIISNFEIL